MSKKLGLPGSAKDRVAVLTGIHPTPCTTPFGDYYMSLQVPLPLLMPHRHSTVRSHRLLSVLAGAGWTCWKFWCREPSSSQSCAEVVHPCTALLHILAAAKSGGLAKAVRQDSTVAVLQSLF